MNTYQYSYEIDTVGEKSVFKLISSTGNCVGKIIHIQEVGRMGSIYRVPLLGTANGGKGLDEVGLDGIEKTSEKIPGLLYIMFTLFIRYIKSIDRETFSISIENPLLTLEEKYRNLYKSLLVGSLIDSGVVSKNVISFRCN